MPGMPSKSPMAISLTNGLAMRKAHGDADGDAGGYGSR